MGLSGTAKDKVLDEIFNGGVSTFPSADLYIQLHNGDPGVEGAGNQIAHTRVQVAFPASASGTLANTGAIDVTSMPAVGAPGVVAWSWFDAAAAGNCWWRGWFSTVSGTAQVDDEDLATNDIESPTHGLIADDRVAFETVEGLSIPAGLAAGTLYWVIATGLVDDMFRVSATQGGAAIDITAEGQAIWRKVVGKTTNLGDTFSVNAGEMDLFLDG